MFVVEDLALWVGAAFEPPRGGEVQLIPAADRCKILFLLDLNPCFETPTLGDVNLDAPELTSSAR